MIELSGTTADAARDDWLWKEGLSDGDHIKSKRSIAGLDKISL